MGPLVDVEAVNAMQVAIVRLKEQGGIVRYGGQVLSGGIFDTGTYVTPCIVEARASTPIVQEETFAPILYLIRFRTLDEAVAALNAVPQGLSSAIFTNDIVEAEAFLSANGSDCGIANVNTGTSGAEIGGAFGGEKDTGGGREAGSDAWKAYMRRQTVTINWVPQAAAGPGHRFQRLKFRISMRPGAPLTGPPGSTLRPGTMYVQKVSWNPRQMCGTSSDRSAITWKS